MRHRDIDTGHHLEGNGGVGAVPLRVPTQQDGRHDGLPPTPVPTSPAHLTVVGPAHLTVAGPVHLTVAGPVNAAHRHSIPLEAEWTARHTTRVLGAALLVAALAGTGVLGLRYYSTGGSQELTALVVGLAVVVVLWGTLIVSTPQMVTLRGSIMTVWSGRDGERFDLADGSQPVDLHGEAGSADWALLLHRPDRTACVLRRHDVDPVAVDQVVRHYRGIAERRATKRPATKRPATERPATERRATGQESRFNH